MAEEAAGASGVAEDLADGAGSDSATISSTGGDSPAPAGARQLRRCAFLLRFISMSRKICVLHLHYGGCMRVRRNAHCMAQGKLICRASCADPLCFCPAWRVRVTNTPS